MTFGNVSKISNETGYWYQGSAFWDVGCKISTFNQASMCKIDKINHQSNSNPIYAKPSGSLKRTDELHSVYSFNQDHGKWRVGVGDDSYNVENI